MHGKGCRGKGRWGGSGLWQNCRQEPSDTGSSWSRGALKERGADSEERRWSMSSSVPRFWESKSTRLRVAKVEKHRPVRKTLKDAEQKDTPRKNCLEGFWLSVGTGKCHAHPEGAHWPDRTTAPPWGIPPPVSVRAGWSFALDFVRKQPSSLGGALVPNVGVPGRALGEREVHGVPWLQEKQATKAIGPLFRATGDGH